jgi:hypothetical protein
MMIVVTQPHSLNSFGVSLDFSQPLKLEELSLLVFRDFVDYYTTRFVVVSYTSEKSFAVVGYAELFEDCLGLMRVSWSLIIMNLRIISNSKQIMFPSRNINSRSNLKLFLIEIVVHQPTTIIISTLLD